MFIKLETSNLELAREMEKKVILTQQKQRYLIFSHWILHIQTCNFKVFLQTVCLIDGV